VPQALCYLGVLQYSDSLLAQLRKKELMENGSEEEVAIRAFTIAACDVRPCPDRITVTHRFAHSGHRERDRAHHTVPSSTDHRRASGQFHLGLSEEIRRLDRSDRAFPSSSMHFLLSRIQSLKVVSPCFSLSIRSGSSPFIYLDDSIPLLPTLPISPLEMFKKFDEKEDVTGSMQLKSSVQVRE
jgi:hypothetical protein